VLVDDVVNPDKFTALGLDLKCDWQGDPDKDTIELISDQHRVKIRPFAGDVTESPGEFSRILEEIKSKLNG